MLREVVFYKAALEMIYLAVLISKINIYNETGDIVYSTQASKTAGVHDFVWDGTMNNGSKAGPGTYEVKVDAVDAAEEAIKSTVVVTGKVRGTETQNGEIFLLVGDRAVGLSNILNTSSNASGGNNNEALTMALSYVGLDINYLNDQIDYSGAGNARVDYNLPKTADRAKILIKDEDGNTVFTADAPTGKGNNSFTWNGRLSDGSQAPAGDYTFMIDAIDSNDKRIAATSTANGRATGVETDRGQIFILVDNKPVRINDILSASQPDTGA